MMKEQILDMLVDATGTDEVKDDLDMDLFEEGLMDSLAMVQFLVDVDAQLGISVPVSEVQREDWNTPNKIIAQIESYQG